MASANPFDILGDDDNDDPSQLIAKQEKILSTKKAAPTAAPTPAAPAAGKFPSKPAPPAQSAREARGNTTTTRGGFGRGGAGRGGARGGSGRPREFRSDNENGFTDRAAPGAAAGEEGGDANKSSEAPRQPYRGPRRESEYDRPPRRAYERHSGTGQGNEVKRQGSGRGNWGSVTDEMVPQAQEETVRDEQKVTLTEKQTEVEAPPAETKGNEDEAANEAGEKEEDKEMTLEEYEKIREEKRKAVLALKTEERKVEIDKDLRSMHLLSTKKSSDEVFIKLGSEKDTQKKKDAERDERAKKSLSINEFLKPAEGERYYGGGRGGRGGRGRGQLRGGYNGGGSRAPPAPAIEDQHQFPTLGGK